MTDSERVPLAVLAPQAELPQGWVHPDLKRLREEYKPVKTAESISDIARAESQTATLSAKVSQLTSVNEQQKNQRDSLLKQAEALDQSVTATEASIGKWRRIERAWKDQIIFHKTIAQSRKRLDDTLPPPAKDFAIGRVLSFVDQWTPLPLRTLVKAPDDDVSAFLKLRAPSMRLDKDGRLEWPSFSDEPCVLAGTSQSTCGNPLCVYTHLDQARHVLLCIASLLESLEPFRGKGKICAVGEIVDRTLAMMFSGPLVSTMTERRALTAMHTLASKIVSLRLFKIGSASVHPKINVTLEELLRHWLGRRSTLQLTSNSPAKSLIEALRQSSGPDAMLQCCIRDIRNEPTPFAWRILMAVQQARSVSAEGYLWLASKGIQLFPTCPEMHKLHLAATVRDSSVSEDECLQIFFRSSDIVVGQEVADALAGTGPATGNDQRISSSLIACVLTKLRSLEAFNAFVSSVLQNADRYGCSVELIHNLHVILAAANFTHSTSFLTASDVSSPSTLPHRVLALHRDVSLVPLAGYSDDVQQAFIRLTKVLDKLKDIVEEHSLRRLTNSLRISLMRCHSTDSSIVLQSIQGFDADVSGSHMSVWNEFLDITLATEGVHGVLEACKAIEATGDMVLQLVAARFLATVAGTCAQSKELLLNSTTAFRKDHRIERDGVLLLASEASAPQRFGVGTTQWVAFLLAFAATCSPRDGADVLRAIPLGILSDPATRTTLRWLVAVDTAMHLTALENVAEFTSGIKELFASWSNDNSLEDSVSLHAITSAHVLALEVYRAIPLAECRPERIAELRLVVIGVAATCGCLHHLLTDS